MEAVQALHHLAAALLHGLGACWLISAGAVLAGVVIRAHGDRD